MVGQDKPISADNVSGHWGGEFIASAVLHYDMNVAGIEYQL